MYVIERVPETVVDHEVDHLRVAHARAGACARHRVRRGRHRLESACERNFDLARPDQYVGEMHRVQARQANLVKGDRGDRHRDAAGDGRLARRDLTLTTLKDLAHQDVVDLLAGEAGSTESFCDCEAAELHAGEARKRSLELPDRGARTCDDDRLCHGITSCLGKATF